MLDKLRLDGKTALVTGAKRGIGRALARALAESGADIIGVSSSLKPSGSEVEKEVTSIGRKFKGYTCDFSNRKALYDFIEKARNDFPEINILVNNAGIILRKPAEEHPDDYWDRVIEINLNAQFVLTREISKGMIERGEGKIIFIASLLTFQGGILVPGYAASKGGIGQLTKALANEWASKGINVNAVAPGYIATDNTAALRADKERSQSILSRIPIGRWGEPDDLAGAVVFLSSQASDYVNGVIIAVDGGWLGR
ncbi:MAG: SDR family oxidoreductase [Candidatus Aminicenantes bacterium]|nr:SDR family oxidoreductase [Candidatus Aminicenantes bacterium]